MISKGELRKFIIKTPAINCRGLIDFWYSLKELSEIACVCDGRCTKKSRRRRGCCGSCQHNHGHFHLNEDVLAAGKDIDYSKKEAVKEYLKYWRPRYGFWISKGCRLPRRLRSLTCLTYFCAQDTNEERIGNWYTKNLYMVSGIILSTSFVFSGRYKEKVLKIIGKEILRTYPKQLPKGKHYQKLMEAVNNIYD